jgi:predicted phage terminase large subunit-like protein
MESPIYKMAFPNTRLADDQNEKAMFMTTQRGFRKAVSVGGQVTGDGGDFIIADDLIKPDEALSDTVRNTTNAWMEQTLLTRLNNPATGRIVMVMQRLHMDDPTGNLLEKGGWYHLNMPAEFKRKTLFEIGGRKWEMNEGDLLHPARLSRDVLDKTLQAMSPMSYAGQYMQSPTPPDGGDFKSHWIKYHDNPSPREMNLYILIDPANVKKRNSGHDPDYTVMIVVGLAPDNNYYILDLIRDRLDPHERIHALIELHKKWNKKSGKPPKVGCEQYGLMTDAFYLDQAQKAINYRFPLIRLGGQIKKEDRIRRLVFPFQDQRIYLPKTIPYTTNTGQYVDLTKEFINEYDTFPVGRHDDILDAFARILDEQLYPTFPELEDRREYYRGGSNIPINFDGFDPGNFRTW